MIIAPRKYTELDYVKIPFMVSPVLSFLIILNRIINALIPSLQILVTAEFVDTAIDIFDNGDSQRIYLPLGLLMVLVAYSWVSGMLIGFAVTRLNMKLNEEFRVAVARKRSKLEYRYIENNDAWELVTRAASNPAERVYGGFDILLRMVDMVIRVVSLLLILATQVWWATIAIIGFSVPLFRASLRSGKTHYEAFKEANKYHRKAGYLLGVISGRENIEERVLFSYTENVNDRWYGEYETARSITTRVSAMNYIKMKGSSIITVFISLLVTGVLLIPLGRGVITIGVFMGLVNATFSLVQMMSWDLSYVTREVANNREYLKDLSEFSQLRETDDANALPDATMSEVSLETIEFINVRFKYPDTDRYILDGLDLMLHGDKHYAFVGENGVGKTTITKLLTGLYPEFEGEILINGRSVREYSMGELKGLFSVVFQDFAKYYVTLKENIALGNMNGVNDDDIAHVLDTIDLTEEVNRLKNGIDTSLGKIKEDATDISGGEWQRVAIARCLVSGAPVYILDEPTASLDPVAESNVYQLFGKVSRNKMTIFITHRLGAAKLADEILVLRGGRIVEHGSHDELMDEGRVYAEMFDAQRSWYH